jgi:hypothetical protein
MFDGSLIRIFFKNISIFQITVPLRKPDSPAFEWSTVGHFLSPAFKWLQQDGRLSLDRCMYMNIYKTVPPFETRTNSKAGFESNSKAGHGSAFKCIL